MATPRHICVFVDGSEYAHTAFLKALNYKSAEDKLTVIHVSEKINLPVMPMGLAGGASVQVWAEANKEVQSQSKKLLEFYVNELKTRKTPNAEVISLGPTEPKAAAAEWVERHNVTLVIAGCRGLGAIKRLFLGSFSEYLLHNCACDVMVRSIALYLSFSFFLSRFVHLVSTLTVLTFCRLAFSQIVKDNKEAAK